MLLGSYHIYECPTCKTKYKKMTLRSGNNFGGEFWSDSKADLPMCPDTPTIGKCDNCSSIFWLEDLEIMEKINSKEKEKHIDIKSIITLDKEDVFFLLKSLNDNQLDREKFLRILYWHLCNDELREESFPIDKGNENLILNLNKLIEVLNKNIEANSIFDIKELSVELEDISKNFSLLNSEDKLEKEEYLKNKYKNFCKNIINADLFNLDINEYPAFIRNEINLVASKLESAFGIFKKDENENRLMIAEIYRELGDFENSIKTIDFYEFNSEYYIELALKIKEFSQNKDSEVKLLK